MKRNYLYIVLVGFVLGLVACGPSNSVSEDEVTAGAPPAHEETTENEEDTAVPEQLPEDSYPIEEVPQATVVPDEYPIATIAPPPNDAYPDSDGAYPAPEGQVWVARPVGVQCEEPEYTDIQDAITDLTAIGVEVYESDTFDLMTASVCGGPTSTHYRVLVDAEDVEAAAALGWEPIEI